MLLRVLKVKKKNPFFFSINRFQLLKLPDTHWEPEISINKRCNGWANNKITVIFNLFWKMRAVRYDL